MSTLPRELGKEPWRTPAFGLTFDKRSQVHKILSVGTGVELGVEPRQPPFRGKHGNTQYQTCYIYVIEESHADNLLDQTDPP